LPLKSTSWPGDLTYFPIAIPVSFCMTTWREPMRTSPVASMHYWCFSTVLDCTLRERDIWKRQVSSLCIPLLQNTRSLPLHTTWSFKHPAEALVCLVHRTFIAPFHTAHCHRYFIRVWLCGTFKLSSPSSHHLHQPSATLPFMVTYPRNESAIGSKLYFLRSPALQ